MDLCNQTAHQLARLLRDREVSSVEITQAMLDRIGALEDTIGAFITVTAEQALQTAKAADEALARGEELPPLAGIPMAMKDNICTRGVKTTCGSKMLSEFVPPYDAFVVQKLQQQHIPVLGKLNMDEFAMGTSTETSYFKKTKNPYDTSKVAGGSSGGSAAAVASGMVPFALGSDTGGSIRQPAAFCGVVGLKPTYGLVSRFGLVAVASSMDQIGPMTRDVTDAALVLNAIAGHDPMDSMSVNRPPVDYTRFLINDVKGKHIGIPVGCLQEGSNQPEVQQAIAEAARVLEDLGATVTYFDLSMVRYALPTYLIICTAEVSSNMGRYDGIKYGYRAEEFADLDDLYAKSRSQGFGWEVKRRILLGTYVLSHKQYEAYFKKAQKVRTLIKQELEQALQQFDVILTPTTSGTAFGIGEKSDPRQLYAADVYTSAASLAGLPAMSVPCGMDQNGLPIGMQLIGRAFDEGTLFQVAYAFEQNTTFHQHRPQL